MFIGRLVRVLLESAYQACLAHELIKRGHSLRRQLSLPLVYEGVQLDAGYRIDLLVDDQIIVEIKSVDRVESIHEAQLLTYLRLASKPVGLLINFNTAHLRDGILRRALTH